MKQQDFITSFPPRVWVPTHVDDGEGGVKVIWHSRQATPMDRVRRELVAADLALRVEARRAESPISS